MMNITQHKEIFLKWAESCTEEVHVDLLAEMIPEFIIERFSGKYVPDYPKEDKLQVSLIADELFYELSERKLIIKRMYFQSLPEKESTTPLTKTIEASDTYSTSNSSNLQQD